MRPKANLSLLPSYAASYGDIKKKKKIVQDILTKFCSQKNLPFSFAFPATSENDCIFC